MCIYSTVCVCVNRKTNAQFAAVISRLQESPQCQRLPFMSFLLLPFQRITRIKMLIEVKMKFSSRSVVFFTAAQMHVAV